MKGGFQKGAFTPAFQQVAVAAAFQCFAFQAHAFQNDCEATAPVTPPVVAAVTQGTGGGEPAARSRTPDVILMPDGLLAILSDVLPELYAPEAIPPVKQVAIRGDAGLSRVVAPRIEEKKLELDLMVQAAQEVRAAQEMLRQVLKDQQEKVRQERLRLAILIALADED